MTRAPHSAVRRLFVGGGRPAGALERLEEPAGVIAALERAPSRALLEVPGIEALLRPMDLDAVLLRAASGQETPAEPEAAAAHGPVSAPASGASEGEHALELPREVAAVPVAQPRLPPQQQPARSGSNSERIGDLLARYAPMPAASAPARTRRVAPAPVAAAAADKAAVPARIPARRALISSWSRRPEQAPARAHITPASGLRERAQRAGGPIAADQPVGTIPATPDITRLIEAARAKGTAAPRPIENPKAPSSTANQLERALDHIARPQRPARVPPPSPRPSEPAAEMPSPGGLRGLYAQALAAASDRARPLEVAPSPAAPIPESSMDTRVRTLPTPSADGDRDLAERLERVLRREARRHGIDVDGGEQ